MVDEHTFGDSDAAIHLVTMLQKDENTQYAKRAYRMLSKFFDSIKEISMLPTRDTRETIMRLWLERFKTNTHSADFPLVVETHLNCVATGQKRKLERQMKEPLVEE